MASFTRRELIAVSAGAMAQAQAPAAPTKFQIACMTIVYSPYPFERALRGIRAAGYEYCAWGTTHPDGANRRAPLIAVTGTPAEAAKIAERTRSEGLEPLMMFSGVNLEDKEAPDKHARRIDQAAAAKSPYLLTFGKTSPGEYENVIACLKHCGPLARKAGVTITIKQHGGNTATGALCSKIIAEVGDEGVKMCYDAGNVLDYENQDPLPDIRTCWRDIRTFAIKDHRNTPKDEDCGPGFGEIDHYKLLMPVARTGLTMPLCCENIFEPLLRRPSTPEGVDKLAQRAREYLESVTRGILSQPA
jgi:sugar phosphate isomerase/epimerase